MFSLFLLIPVIFITLYIFLILSFIIGWHKIPTYHPGRNNALVFISVIIPFRDESIILPKLLNSLNHQDYPNEYWEVIFVDDHSTDNGYDIIRHYPLKMKFKTVKNHAGETGKKAALKKAMSLTMGELIVQTDCDCLHSPSWLSTLSGFYQEKSPDLIMGPVILIGTGGLFQRFQELEFFSLLASTAGSAGINHPLMCNGANLAYTRASYQKICDGNTTGIASGDDMFLLHELKKSKETKLDFLKSTDALVASSASPNVWSFIEQRKRWSSKSIYYQDAATITVAITVLIINLTLLTSFIYLFFNPASWWIFTSLFILKSIPDYVLLKKVTVFFSMQKATRYFIPVQFLYFFYVSFTAFLSFFRDYSWKGRKVKK